MSVLTESKTGITIRIENDVWYGEHPHLASAVRYFLALINVHVGNRGGPVAKDDINTPINSLFASTGNHYGDYIRKAFRVADSVDASIKEADSGFQYDLVLSLTFYYHEQPPKQHFWQSWPPIEKRRFGGASLNFASQSGQFMGGGMTGGEIPKRNLW